MKLFSFIFFSLCLFTQAISQEYDFQIAISSEKSLKEIKQELAYHFSDVEEKKLLFAVDIEDDNSPETNVHLIGNKHLSKKHGQYLGYPRTYVAKLGLQEETDIRYIVTFLANNHILKIAAHRSELEAAGDRIDHVHPLNFLSLVFSDEELKVCFRNIRSKGWIWGDFIGGIKESLMTESKVDNMRDDFVRDFSKKVSSKRESIYPYIAPSIQKRNWDEFVDILITRIPRGGDHDRYDD